MFRRRVLVSVNIHAAVAVDGRDRQCLERLCRYIRRPPLSLERPRFHMLRYHLLFSGIVLAGHSGERAEVVPQRVAKDENACADVSGRPWSRGTQVSREGVDVADAGSRAPGNTASRRR